MRAPAEKRLPPEQLFQADRPAVIGLVVDQFEYPAIRNTNPKPFPLGDR